MTDNATVPRWNLQPDQPDEWASRFPAEYVLGDLTAAELLDWRDYCRAEFANNGRIVPYTTTPIDPRKPVASREIEGDPLRQWIKRKL